MVLNKTVSKRGTKSGTNEFPDMADGIACKRKWDAVAFREMLYYKQEEHLADPASPKSGERLGKGPLNVRCESRWIRTFWHVFYQFNCCEAPFANHLILTREDNIDKYWVCTWEFNWHSIYSILSPTPVVKVAGRGVQLLRSHGEHLVLISSLAQQLVPLSTEFFLRHS